MIIPFRYSPPREARIDLKERSNPGGLKPPRSIRIASMRGAVKEEIGGSLAR
jgi:hypothetical protein